MDFQHERQNYRDIINLPHHEITTRLRMPVINRAAYFAPFAALKGYDDAVNEKARYTDKRIELDESEKAILGQKLLTVLSKEDLMPEITVTYFLPDSKKAGGVYIKHTGTLRKINECERTVIFTDGLFIPIDDIYEIEGDVFNNLFL